MTLMFVFTAGALIWLSRDVDQAEHARSDATSIAFQASRAGAQQVRVDTLFGDASPSIDPGRARSAVAAVAADLLARFGEAGTVTNVVIEANRVTVTVSVTVSGRTAIGTGSATAHQGVIGPEH
jgi:hypothetical protein